MHFFSSFANYLEIWALTNLPVPHGKDPWPLIALSYAALGEGMILIKFFLPKPMNTNLHFSFLTPIELWNFSSIKTVLL